MIFRQLFDYQTWTYSYLIADEITREAALIDSVREQAERDTKLILELGLELKYLLETHVHADHITAVSELKQLFPQAQSVVSGQACAACADLHVNDGDLLKLGDLEIQVLSTPGHTDGCVSYRVGNRVFTGDALFIRGSGRTDFQQGDAGKLYDGVTQKLFTLPDATEVYPGHNYAGMTMSTIGEEKRFNPRFAGKSRAQFIALMRTLNLPAPKRLAESVPANLNCGKVSAQTR